MGKLKEYWMDREDDRAISLANILGISVEEIYSLDYEIVNNTTMEGFNFGYRIEFNEASPTSILSKIDRLENGFTVYLEPYELESEYEYGEQIRAIKENDNYIQNYRDEIARIQSLLGITLQDRSVQYTLHRQLFIGIIGAMETFLSDAFINLTLNNDYCFRRFIETHPELSKRKFELKDIFNEYDRLRHTAKKVMLDTIYHKLPNINRMYSLTFDIEFPDIEKMHEYVVKRHDLVHRNGKTKDGRHLQIDADMISDLIIETNVLVEDVFKKTSDDNFIPF